MLEFSEDFFSGEERDGFYIESLMKKNWAVATDILHEIDLICERNNIRWFADSGTLLGAARGGGFISWDDDIDIVMPREDLYKFAAVAPKELPEYYAFMEGGIEASSVGSVVTTNVPRTRDKSFYEKVYHGFPYTVCVDIFPLDDVVQDPEIRQLQKSILNALTASYAMFQNRLAPKEECVKSLVQIMEALNMPVPANLEKKDMYNIKKIIFDIFNQVGQIGNNQGVDEWTYPHRFAWESTNAFKKEWFRDYVELPFENIMVKAPIDYEKMLEACYGPEWRIPKQVAAGHNYPCYNNDRMKYEQDQAKQLLTQVLAQTTGQSPEPDTDYKRVSYDDDFNVYEAELEGEIFILLIPTFDFTKSDKYVYNEAVWVDKKNKVCEQMKVVIYDGGPNSYVCGIKK